MTKNNFLYPSIEKMIEKFSPGGEPLSKPISEIQQVYLADNRPWTIGYSGGKDSTVVLELVYYAISLLPKDQRKKPIFVVSSDTLVETPVVVNLIKSTLDEVNENAKSDKIPMSGHLVTPKRNDTFWVNLLGKGYPAPTQSFRWCTERMKIDPVSEFITSKVAEFGEVVVVLGSRSQESASRAQVIKKHKIDGSLLSRHTSLPNAYIYMPIVSWSADEVWEFLMGAPKPWGGSNQLLFDLYKGSNAGECPLVIDNSTPSCGNSRFGCWTCTVVQKERAINGLIQSGDAWLKPLLDFRNMLSETTKVEKKNKYRNFKRRSGKVEYLSGKFVKSDQKQMKHSHGPYWIKYRQQWLQQLLSMEKDLKDNGHDIELITPEELHFIRREWLHDPNEPDWADTLPIIYREVYGQDLEWLDNDAGAFTKPDADLLEELGEKYGAPPNMVMKLIELELSMDGLSKRKGIFDRIGTIINQDWDTLENIQTRNEDLKSSIEYDNVINELTKEHDQLAKQIESL